MSNSATNDSRRSFIRHAGVAVSATLAGSGAVAASVTDGATVQHQLGVLEDTNAIRALQQRYFALLQQGAEAELRRLFIDQAAHTSGKHAATVLDARHDDDDIAITHDRQSARATVQARLQLATPVTGAGTLQQMARLQGQAEQLWREQGVYEVQYVRLGSEWKIRSLQYRKA